MDALVFEILFGSVIVSDKFSNLFRRGDIVSQNCVFREVALHSLLRVAPFSIVLASEIRASSISLGSSMVWLMV